MDIRIALVEQANTVISRRNLIERVWPKRGVGEIVFAQHVSALRKASEESYLGKH
jgi:DNA-binding winged helix-turn-helix (wHTH) protein